MSTLTKNRLEAAKLVIPGAICGDIIGSSYEFHPTYDYNFDLISYKSNFTDDTVCTIAIADAIVKGIPFDKSLQMWCRKYRSAGYGGMFRRWIDSENPLPYYSYGNGSAMRVSPVGAISQTLEEALDLAKRSAEVTHNHPEGIKGAQATATAIFLGLHGAPKEAIMGMTTGSFGYELADYESTRKGYEFDETCQGSVPQSIVSFVKSHDYESAIRLAVYMGGDADTMGAICGAIAAGFYGYIPHHILQECMNLLPQEMIDVIDKFNAKLEEINNYTFKSKYWHPAVTADNVIFGFDGETMKVLLVRRGNDPYKGKWALPGGFLRESDKSIEECAERELFEETNLKVKHIEQIGCYSDINRDPRERVITIAFLALTDIKDVKGGDDASEAQWFSIDDLPELAFDHTQILKDALDHLRKSIHFKPIGYNLLPELFSMRELQRLYECILGIKFDRRNFAKKMLHLEIIKSMGEYPIGNSKRITRLYSFDKEKYIEMRKNGLRLEFDGVAEKTT